MVSVNDKVKIRTRDGKIWFLRVTGVEQERITGLLLAFSDQKDADADEKENMQKVTIAYRDIDYLKRGEFSPAKTTGAVAAGTATVGAGMYFLVLLPFIKGLF